MYFGLHLYLLFAVECEDGSYGYNCVDKCSSNCLHDFPCNKTNGHCEQGCKPGYSKPLCDKRMISRVEKTFFMILAPQFLNSVSSILLINDISFLYFDNPHFNFQTVQSVFMETAVKSLARKNV